MLVGWGIGNTFSGYAMRVRDSQGRGMTLKVVVLFTAVGQLGFAWAIAGFAYLVDLLRPGSEIDTSAAILVNGTSSGSASTPSGMIENSQSHSASAVAIGLIVMFAGEILITGWFRKVKIARESAIFSTHF